MWKLVSVITGIIFFAIFFIQNMVKVPVRFIITEPVEIRLTYLLLTSFILGYILCMVLYVAKEVRKGDYKNELTEEEDEDDLLG